MPAMRRADGRTPAPTAATSRAREAARDGVQDASRDGPGLADDVITVVIDDTAIEVKQPAASCDAIGPKRFVTPKLSSTPCRAALM